MIEGRRAVSSQLSAAIADSIGSGGLMIEVSRRKLGIRGAFITASALSIAVVWRTDPFFGERAVVARVRKALCAWALAHGEAIEEAGVSYDRAKATD